MGTEKSPARRSTRCPAASTGPASTRPRWARRCASCSSWPAACATAHELKFWTPGGSSTPMLTAEHLDVPLDFEGVVAAGSMLGTTATDDLRRDDCIVRAALRFTEFYAHESCGKCTPCREGTYWMVQILRAARGGRRHSGGHRHPARHLRQHLRPLVLRPRRRRDQPDRLVDPVLPGRVHRALRAWRLPVQLEGGRPQGPGGSALT